MAEPPAISRKGFTLIVGRYGECKTRLALDTVARALRKGISSLVFNAYDGSDDVCRILRELHGDVDVSKLGVFKSWRKAFVPPPLEIIREFFNDHDTGLVVIDDLDIWYGEQHRSTKPFRELVEYAATKPRLAIVATTYFNQRRRKRGASKLSHIETHPRNVGLAHTVLVLEKPRNDGVVYPLRSFDFNAQRVPFTFVEPGRFVWREGAAA